MVGCWAPDARAQEIYSFPTLPNPWSKLVQGGDGALYGTTGGGGLKGLGTVFRITPQGNLRTLCSFVGTNGAQPSGGLALAPDGALYGTTPAGGAAGAGTVYKVTTNGLFTTLASFDSQQGTGGSPENGLVWGQDGAFYGTTFQGVFRVTTNGVLTQIASFSSLGGASPLVQAADGALYGATGGWLGGGTVYRVTTNGALTTLVDFPSTNNDSPDGGLVVGADGALYGISTYGGDLNAGSIFRVTTNGTLTRLVSFDSAVGPAWPTGGLVSGADGSLYGISVLGGTNFNGTVFQLTPNGDLRVLASVDGPGEAPLMRGQDGALYGTLDQGGDNLVGSIFRVTTNGGLTLLFSYPNSEGASPQAGLVLAGDGALYGTTPQGGLHNAGMVYRATTNGEVMPVVNFDNYSNGVGPRGGLVLGNDGALYGTTVITVFRLALDGSLSTLASFDPDTNGLTPMAALTLGPDGAFYGTTTAGGTNGWGSVFRVTTNGALSTRASFDETTGASPQVPLVQGCDGAFYGVTSQGVGTNFNYGSIFRVTTNGVLSTLFTFDLSFFNLSFNNLTEYVGPCTSLVVGDDCALYGTAGCWMFRLSTDGTMTRLTKVNGPVGALMKTQDGSFYGAYATNTSVMVFKANTNGVASSIGLVELTQSSRLCGSLTAGTDGYLYGVTSQGGSRGGGSLFRTAFSSYHLRVLSLGFPWGSVSVKFAGLPGQQGRLLRATNLSGPWVPLGQTMVQDNGIGFLSDGDPPPTAAFYQVVGP